MPPKIRTSKQNIIKAALDIIRKEGEQGLNARNIASVLGCSTQPVFSNFESMEELHKAVLAAAYDIYTDFLQRESEKGEYAQYKAFGMAYILFAKEEKELFKLLFMRDRNGEDLTPTRDFSASVQIIMNANGVSEEKATLMHLEMWAFVHGIAVMFATSFLSLEWESVSDMLTDVYQGLRARHLAGEK